MGGNEKKTVDPAPDVDDRPLAGFCHCLDLDTCSGHLYPDRCRCDDLGGPSAVVDSDRSYSAASLGFVVEGRGSSMAREVRILVCMELEDMNLEAVEGVQEGREPHSSVGK